MKSALFFSVAATCTLVLFAACSASPGGSGIATTIANPDGGLTTSDGGTSACAQTCTAAPANGTPTCTAGQCGFACNSGYERSNGACVSTLVVVPGQVGLRTTQARMTESGALQLNVQVANGVDGVPFALTPSQLLVKTDDGLLRAAAAFSSGTAWVDGKDFPSDGRIAGGSSFQWRVQVPAVTRASGVQPLELQFTTSDGRKASASVSLEPCTTCGSTCTYLDRDLQNCGACNKRPDGTQAMQCSGGAFKCDATSATLCAQGGASSFACVDTQSSTKHCGACGVAAPANGVCNAGVSGCAGNTTLVNGVCGTPQWRQVSSGTTDALQSVWQAANGTVFAAGGNFPQGSSNGVGKVLRGSGGAFSIISTTGQTFSLGIWGASDAELWCGGYGGTIQRWNGTGWAATPVPNATRGAAKEINSLWGSSSTDVWATRGAGEIVRWNGSQWLNQADPVINSTNGWLGIGGTSSSDVWSVGYYNRGVPPFDNTTQGSSAHWNGAVWSQVAMPTTASGLFTTWFAAPNDGWAVGLEGTIVRWNGTAWLKVASGTTEKLQGVWGPSANDVWVVGDNGVMLHWNGTAFSEVPSGTTQWLHSVRGISAYDIWAVGEAGTLLHYALQ